MEKQEKQELLSEMVVLKDGFDSLEKVGGVASAYLEGEVVSGALVMQYDEVVETTNSVKDVVFSYKPSFLMFTEGPVTVEALKKLKTKPELVFVNGHGIAHPRGAGLACYVGVSTGIPCIGIAKEALVGEYVLPRKAKEANPVTLMGRKVGWVLKPGRDHAPIFISPGNLVSVESSLKLVKKFSKKGRFPEPLLQAREYVKKVRKRVERDIQRQRSKDFVAQVR